MYSFVYHLPITIAYEYGQFVYVYMLYNVLSPPICCYMCALHSDEPNLELQAVLKRYPKQVYFFQGSVMNPDNLDRVLVREADAVR